jgi:hypothetical protein
MDSENDCPFIHFHDAFKSPFNHLQLLQFLELQTEQLSPFDDEETNSPPHEKPKTERSLLTSLASHLGQDGFSCFPLR